MTFDEYYSKTEEQIRAQLGKADDAAHIRAVLDDHLGRMLIQYNESTKDPLLQESALALISAARSCLDLTDVYGQILLRRQSAGTAAGAAIPSRESQGGSSGIRQILTRLLPILGAACLLCAVVICAASSRSASQLPAVILLTAGGGVLLYLAGTHRAPGGASPETVQAVPVYDKERILRVFRRILMTMDRSLSGMAETQAAQQPRTGASEGAGGDLSDEEDLLRLFSGQLEALYSKDGDYALDELSQVRHYLHRHHVELCDDWNAHKEWFEYVPTAASGVLRPALIHSDSKTLLIKGLAGMSS